MSYATFTVSVAITLRQDRKTIMLESIKDDKNNREYSGSFSRDGNGVNAVFPINILYDENTIYINVVLRLSPWITVIYGDTKIFGQAVFAQPPCLHSLILQATLAELAVPLIWQVPLAKLEKSDTLQQIFSCSLGCVPNTLCHRGNESKYLLIIGLLPVFPNLFVPASL